MHYGVTKTQLTQNVAGLFQSSQYMLGMNLFKNNIPNNVNKNFGVGVINTVADRSCVTAAMTPKNGGGSVIVQISFGGY